MLAFTQRKTGHLDDAFRNYRRALEISRPFPQAREYLGEAHIQAALQQVEILRGLRSGRAPRSCRAGGRAPGSRRHCGRWRGVKQPSHGRGLEVSRPAAILMAGDVTIATTCSWTSFSPASRRVEGAEHPAARRAPLIVVHQVHELWFKQLLVSWRSFSRSS